MNLYIGTHIHHIEGLKQQDSDELLGKLMNHASMERYAWSLEWENEGDLVVWDNTCVVSFFDFLFLCFGRGDRGCRADFGNRCIELGEAVLRGNIRGI